ncbi:MAG: hypothetical protein O7G86_17840 [Gammaproteobacteria bacterium]|nr:hypothetical protein [Gammaproteobacteria bacterium]MCZ6855778.1 hypothetical protein [Gammaproteobacteria bacterium]
MSTALQKDIDAVDSAYEFLLAYAAQGREDDVGGPAPRARDILTELDEALVNIVARLSEDAAASDERGQFDTLVIEDIAKSLTALALVRAQSRISSELIDNLNASIHLRTVLTNLWLLSETLEIDS